MINAKTVSNSFGEIKIDKEKATSRIDPVDDIIDAWKLAMGRIEIAENYASEEFLQKLWG